MRKGPLVKRRSVLMLGAAFGLQVAIGLPTLARAAMRTDVGSFAWQVVSGPTYVAGRAPVLDAFAERSHQVCDSGTAVLDIELIHHRIYSVRRVKLPHSCTPRLARGSTQQGSW